MPRLAILIPSRTQPRQGAFLKQALASIRAQTRFSAVEIDVIIAIDKDEKPPADFPGDPIARFINSHTNSLAGALNAAAAAADCDYMSILEDDDQWHPNYLELAFETLKLAPFVSATQIEADENNYIIRIQDFCTPTSWTMERRVWDKIGGFNERYRLHQDNEWLGRLGDSDVPRMHMVECTAPVIPQVIMETRPLLANVLRNAGPNFKLARHHLPLPLVLRMLHVTSLTGQIGAEKAYADRSAEEKKWLIEQFGRLPC